MLLTKPQLIEQTAAIAGLSKKDTTAVVDALLFVIKEALAAGGAVSLFKFGIFKPRLGAEHMGRNPHTNEPMVIKSKVRVKFSAAKELRDSVN